MRGISKKLSQRVCWWWKTVIRVQAVKFSKLGSDWLGLSDVTVVDQPMMLRSGWLRNLVLLPQIPDLAWAKLPVAFLCHQQLGFWKLPNFFWKTASRREFPFDSHQSHQICLNLKTWATNEELQSLLNGMFGFLWDRFSENRWMCVADFDLRGYSFP